MSTTTQPARPDLDTLMHMGVPLTGEMLQALSAPPATAVVPSK